MEGNNPEVGEPRNVGEGSLDRCDGVTSFSKHEIHCLDQHPTHSQRGWPLQKGTYDLKVGQSRYCSGGFSRQGQGCYFILRVHWLCILSSITATWWMSPIEGNIYFKIRTINVLVWKVLTKGMRGRGVTGQTINTSIFRIIRVAADLL